MNESNRLEDSSIRRGGFESSRNSRFLQQQREGRREANVAGIETRDTSCGGTREWKRRKREKLETSAGLAGSHSERETLMPGNKKVRRGKVAVQRPRGEF